MLLKSKGQKTNPYVSKLLQLIGIVALFIQF